MRITLDTNQLVRALMRPPQLATFVMAWQARRFTVVCSPELIQEYEWVLADPEVAALLSPELVRAFRTHLVYDIEIILLPVIAQICRDPDDDKVIATAVLGEVTYLVTEDRDLTTPDVTNVLERAGITVVSVNRLIQLLDQ